jgi:hypothetical protein
VAGIKCVSRFVHGRNFNTMSAGLPGETVPDEERIVVKDTTGELTLNSSTATLPTVASDVLRSLPPAAASAGAVAGAAVSDAERVTWMQEKEKLYQQIDERVS